LVAPLLFLAMGAVIFLMRLDLMQEQVMYEFAEEAKEKAFAAHFLKQEEGDGSLQELYSKKRFTVKIPLPLLAGRRIEFQEVLRYRGFTGLKTEGTPMTFPEMEEEGTDGIVWVFPRRGERYHKRECRIVTVYPEERLLSEKLKRTFRPCENCDPAALEPGSPVYCFPSGSVYHKESCTAVERYVIPMNLQQAEEKGYTACSYCSR